MQGSSSTQGGNDQETVFAPPPQPRVSPFILLVDPLQGFVLPAASDDSIGGHLKRTGAGGRPPAVNIDARAYLRTTSLPAPRHSGTPFNSSTARSLGSCLATGPVLSLFLPHVLEVGAVVLA